MIGGTLWMLAMLMMKNGIVSRQTNRSNRENRFKFNKMLTTKKLEAYDKYIDNVMSMVNKLAHKNNLNPQDLAAFNDSAAFVKINGSKHFRALNDHITSLLNSGSPLRTLDQQNLRVDLIKVVRADLA